MKLNIRDKIVKHVIEAMQTEGTDWTKPWRASQGDGPRNAKSKHGPRNAKSKRRYRGVNVFLTSYAAAMNGWRSQYWQTYKGWQALGHQVAKGSKGTEVVLWKPSTYKDKTTGEEKQGMFVRSYNVFNAEQLDPENPFVEPTEATVNMVDAIERAEALLTGSGAHISYGGDVACYVPTLDMIKLPPREAFKSTEGFYGTALHELVHWSGHKDRCDRDLSGRFGDPEYAFEELVAELGAALLSVSSGVVTEPRADHAKYLNSWVRCLTDNPEAIWSAFSKAQKAADYIEGLCDSDEPETVDAE